MATTQAVHPRAAAVLDYWLGSSASDVPKDHFPGDKLGTWFPREKANSAVIDQYIKDNFEEDVKLAGAGSYDDWLRHPLNGVAGVILMDQFTRNIYRGTPATFSLDDKAKQWAVQLLDSGLADGLPHMFRCFLLLTLEHSEQLVDQERAVAEFKAELAAVSSTLGPEHSIAKLVAGFLQYAMEHRDVVAEFGRFPHRNAILGRPNTAAEEAGLAAGTIKVFG